MYVNTKKDLFLGTHKFDILELDKTELLERMTKCLTEDIDLEELTDGESTVDEILTADSEQEQAEAIVLALKSLMENRCINESEMTTALATDPHVDGSELVSLSEADDWCEIVELEGGITYIKVLSNNKDGAIADVYVMLYIGADKKIHDYVPTYGNTVFAGTDFQLGGAEGNDDDAWEELMDEAHCNVDPDDYENYVKAAWDAYNNKFGTEPSPADDEKDEECEVALELNEDYIQEDIRSNAVVIQA